MPGPSDADLLELMRRFRVAYAQGDREGLLGATTEDFEWHQHEARQESDLPTGRILVGVDALLEELRWRSEHWSGVEYAGLEERAAGDLLVQTFTIRGLEDGRPFHARAVDLYPVRNGAIARKDTYWKYLR